MTIVPPSRSASARASADLPLAVGPATSRACGTVMRGGRRRSCNDQWGRKARRARRRGQVPRAASSPAASGHFAASAGGAVVHRGCLRRRFAGGAEASLAPATAPQCPQRIAGGNCHDPRGTPPPGRNHARHAARRRRVPARRFRLAADRGGVRRRVAASRAGARRPRAGGAGCGFRGAGAGSPRSAWSARRWTPG